MFDLHLGERLCNTEQVAVDSTLDNRKRIQENQSSLPRVTNGHQQDKTFEIKGTLLTFIQQIKKKVLPKYQIHYPDLTIHMKEIWGG